MSAVDTAAAGDTRADLVAAATLEVAGLADAPGARARDVRRLTGGASRETWTLDLETPDGPVAVVARIARDDALNASLEVEAAAIVAARETGAPVPEVLGVERVPSLGATVMVMRRVTGETIARRILRDDDFAAVRPSLARRLGQVAASVHTAAVPPEVPGAAGDPVEALVAEMAGSGAGRVPPPGLALGLRWLREHRPPASRRALVHGDLRLGNVVVDPDGLVALLDWELVHVGDPVEDLGWLCAKVWRFGAELPVGGLGTRRDLLDGYESVAGWRPDAEALRWWELYGTVRWGLMTGVMAERHLSGAESSVELVTIGRRASEQEYDVLLELGHVRPDDVAAASRAADDGPGAAPVGDVHGVPTAADLLDGVRHYLRDGPLRLPGAAGFEARVALTAVETVHRELTSAARDNRAHTAVLEALGCPDDAALSVAIGDGSLDARWDDVVRVVVDGTLRRVRVANPRHLTRPVAGSATDELCAPSPQL